MITLAVPTSPNSFDPRVGTDEISQKVFHLVYDDLLKLDAQLRVGPGLATHWEQPDAVTYLVHLRQGVRFHDGHELTSADVVHTFGSLIDPKFVSARRGAYTVLARVEPVDKYTARFVLKEPSGSFLIQLVLPIIPAGAGNELRTRPVGTGPYAFARYAVDDRLELVAFKDYYQGAAKNAGVTLKVVPDEIMRGLELKKGTVDMVVNDLSPDTVEQFREDGSMQIAASTGTDYAYVGLNLRDPMLADKRVRQAISYAIDRQAIVKYLRRGLAQPAVGVVPPASWAFASDVPQFAHDPAKAMALLDAAGYPDPDGNGPRPRLRVTLKVSTNEFYRLQATVIQQDLRKVGIDADVRSYEFATLSKDVAGGNFQLVTLQWVGITDPDMLRRVFHSKQMPPSGFNRGFYSNPEIDRLIDEASSATDYETRGNLYREVQRRVAEDAPYISLWYKTNVAVAQHDLTGITLSPVAAFTFLKDVSRRAAME
ncbi:MAG TPA: ABC transporter substrate-binding protein [Vicinamibacterales bacterium]|nr:ABC transporter substrate-binding protein [Vicinamibacterales bacterium]